MTFTCKTTLSYKVDNVVGERDVSGPHYGLVFDNDFGERRSSPYYQLQLLRYSVSYLPRRGKRWSVKLNTSER